MEEIKMIELVNITNSRNVPLFVNYPPNLLDFAIFCCVIFIIIGVPGNLITIIALTKSKKVHNATAAFIINLAVSDLMFGLFNLPMAASLFGHRAWIHTGFLCLLFPILRYGLLAVSLFTVLAITINRYVMIAHPRLYRKLYTKTSLTIMLTATWVGAFGALVPTLLGFWGTFGLDPKIGSCTILPDADGKSPKTFLFLFAFVMPCLAICWCYARIFCIVHRAYKKSHLAELSTSINNRDSKCKSSCAYDSWMYNADTPSDFQRQEQTSSVIDLQSENQKASEISIITKPTEETGKHLNFEHQSTWQLSPPKAFTNNSLSTPILHTKAGDMVSPYSKCHDTEVITTLNVAPIDKKSPVSETPLPKEPSSAISETLEPKYEVEKLSTIKSGKPRRIPGTPRHQTLSSQDKRLLKMILVIFISFVSCYLPITLIKIFGKDEDPILNILGLLLIYMTTCINPIIYVLMSSEYRQAYASLFGCNREVDVSNHSPS